MLRQQPKSGMHSFPLLLRSNKHCHKERAIFGGCPTTCRRLYLMQWYEEEYHPEQYLMQDVHTKQNLQDKQSTNLEGPFYWVTRGLTPMGSIFPSRSVGKLAPTFGFSTKASILPSASITTTPYRDGSSTLVTKIVPSAPLDLWNSYSSRRGNSQMTSLNVHEANAQLSLHRVWLSTTVGTGTERVTGVVVATKWSRSKSCGVFVCETKHGDSRQMLHAVTVANEASSRQVGRLQLPYARGRGPSVEKRRHNQPLTPAGPMEETRARSAGLRCSAVQFLFRGGAVTGTEGRGREGRRDSGDV